MCQPSPAAVPSVKARPKTPQTSTSTLSVPPLSPGRAGSALLRAPPPSRRHGSPPPAGSPYLSEQPPAGSRRSRTGRLSPARGGAARGAGGLGHAAPGSARGREGEREAAAGVRTGRAPGRRCGGPSLLRAAACARCLCLPRQRCGIARGAALLLRYARLLGRAAALNTPQHGSPAASAP